MRQSPPGLLCKCAWRSLYGFPQLRRRVWHIDMVNAQGRQCVHHGVGHRGGRAIAASLTDTLDPERMERIWRHGLAEEQRWHITARGTA